MAHGLMPGDLMVTVLESGLGGLGSSPGQGTVLCSWARHFTSHFLLNTLSHFILQKPGQAPA